MTTRPRSPQSVADPGRLVERVVNVFLVLAVLAALVWISWMIVTVVR